MKQIRLLKDEPKAHGGELRKTRKGRGARTLSTQDTLHLVMRSSKARGNWSMRNGQNPARIKGIFEKFARRYCVRLFSIANVGNHLHVHLKLTNRHTYRQFIRATTAAIAMAVTGTSRWKKKCQRFWDYRPFTRVVIGRRGFLRVLDYLRINQLEANGVSRDEARLVILRARAGP